MLLGMALDAIANLDAMLIQYCQKVDAIQSVV